ncbi:tRNA pseudouridine synthase [Plakobranchus ocellatus]|uniref:tRNA pseudouridine synthase n=1 Tax=Plakobranchus ocellatus TaxID=259542 RepID=A0AAV3Y596_9GAST|nr:tRNA pseudouridine synthase [Plakobranchus ocellatus]
MLQRVCNFLHQIKRLNPAALAMAESEKAQTDLLGKRPAENDVTDDSKTNKKKKKKHVVQLGKSEGFKRKIALLIAYNGAGYYGVQVNPGFPTIESEFFPALVKVGAIPEDHATTPSKMWFQRAVLVPDFVKKLNEILPPAIQVIGYIRTTNGFDSKNFCCARTYMYMLPTFAFAPIEKFITDEYRVTAQIIEQARKILTRFEGTHKFHNFTSGVKFEQACASRYIIKFECSDPFVRDGLEFVTLKVKGQSFMLHHIRKMIGLTIAIVRGYCGEKVIDSCWGPEKVDVPKAPGLGLVLEQLHFDGYNKKFGCDGVHEPIDWSQYEETVEKFKEEQIISQIVAKEKEERVTFEWLRTLQFHNFDTPRLEGPQKPWVPVTKMLAEKKDQTAVEKESTAKESIRDDESSTKRDETIAGNKRSDQSSATTTTIDTGPELDMPVRTDESTVAVDSSQGNDIGSATCNAAIAHGPCNETLPVTNLKACETVDKQENS